MIIPTETESVQSELVFLTALDFYQAPTLFPQSFQAKEKKKKNGCLESWSLVYKPLVEIIIFQLITMLLFAVCDIDTWKRKKSKNMVNNYTSLGRF